MTSNRLWGFALAAVMLLGTLGAADPAVAADGSVRFLSAGPVRLGDGHVAHMRVFLPAVQRPIHVHFLGEKGEVLTSVEVEPPARGAGPFFEVFFEASFVPPDPGVPGSGRLSIRDGTSNTILVQEGSKGIIAILIGLRGLAPSGGMGTMQVFDAAGRPVLILPYIEQDNLLRR
jgi:hypothetical protein